MTLAHLRTIIESMTKPPWAMHGRPSDRIIEAAETHPDGACYCVAEQMDDDDAVGIVALRNHADALLTIIVAVDGVLARFDPAEELGVIQSLRYARGQLEVLP